MSGISSDHKTEELGDWGALALPQEWPVSLESTIALWGEDEVLTFADESLFSNDGWDRNEPGVTLVSVFKLMTSVQGHVIFSFHKMQGHDLNKNPIAHNYGFHFLDMPSSTRSHSGLYTHM